MTTNNGKKIWVFAFEYAGIAKVGGLGEVSANQCRSLVVDPALDIIVFLPSHGRHVSLREKLHLVPLQEPTGRKLVLCGHLDPDYFGIIPPEPNDEDLIHSDNGPSYFEVEIWNGYLDGVPVNLLVGANPYAAKILHDSEVYGSTTLNAKLGLFAQVMREYIRYCIFTKPQDIPELLHIHDHHPVPAMLNIRQELNLVQRDVETVITMHLLTWPRRELEFFWKCGVNNEKMPVFLGSYRTSRSFRDIFNLAQSDADLPPTLEKIGCLVADRVIAVSESFLNSDIIPNCGGKAIRHKSDFTWNGCDWEYESMLQDVKDRFDEETHLKAPSTPSVSSDFHSSRLRSLFLTKKLGNLAESEPKIHSPLICNFVRDQFNAYPYNSDCTVEPFSEDGPLVLITGRVSPQKGIETLLKTLPNVIQHIPNVKFVFLMVPTAFTLPDLEEYMEVARKYPNNVRFLFGIAGSIYFLAHLSADVYCCPSRWEPFGIVALEAMAAKIPVVATIAGGLKESIIPVDQDLENGTGLLVPIDDVSALSRALVSLISVMIISEKHHNAQKMPETEFTALLSKIIYPNLRERVQFDPGYGEILRSNAYRRVRDHFKWSAVSQKLKNIYLGF
ncbi:MAG: glycosyltransferase [Promethearchaeota archaeon]